MQPEVIGIPTANLALALSALSLIASTSIGLYVAFRDRADIRVAAAQSDLFFGPNKVGPLLGMTASNRGRRPVTLVSYGVEYSDKSMGYFFPYPSAPLPKRLDEGEHYTGLMPLRTTQESIRARGKRLTGFYFKTADGRTYRQRVWPWSPMYKLLTKSQLAPEAKNLEFLDPMGPMRALLGGSGN